MEKKKYQVERDDGTVIEIYDGQRWQERRSYIWTLQNVRPGLRGTVLASLTERVCLGNDNTYFLPPGPTDWDIGRMAKSYPDSWVLLDTPVCPLCEDNVLPQDDYLCEGCRYGT